MENTEENNTEVSTAEVNVIEQKESIEVIKNGKGFGWRARVFIKDTDNEALDRLEGINKELRKRFGGLKA